MPRPLERFGRWHGGPQGRCRGTSPMGDVGVEGGPDLSDADPEVAEMAWVPLDEAAEFLTGAT